MSPGRGIFAAGPRRRGAPPIEYSLLLTVTLCLVALGAVMVFSASSTRSLLGTGGDGAYFLKRTLLWGAVGLLAMRVASLRGARIARAATPLILAVSLGLLVAVLMPGVGHTVNGAQRWIGSGALIFQPSELAKVALILYGAHLLASKPKQVRSLGEMAPYLGMVGLALVLITVQPDLGTAMATTVAVSCLLIVAGAQLRTLAPLGAIAAIGVLGMIATNPYQQERLTSFLHPSADSSDAGYQGLQAQIALGSGGVLGVGLGESVQKASYLPEAHTDMIAAVLGEETGLAGIGVLICLFGIFGYAGFRAAHRARDRYSKLMAAGLTSLIVGQAAINLFAVLGLAPLTGVTLPFVSYGGTSLVVSLTSAGLLMNVARGRATAGAARPRQTQRASTTARADAAGAGARLRVIDGGANSKRRAPGRASDRDRGRRDRRARDPGAGRRRRAAG